MFVMYPLKIYLSVSYLSIYIYLLTTMHVLLARKAS